MLDLLFMRASPSKIPISIYFTSFGNEIADLPTEDICYIPFVLRTEYNKVADKYRKKKIIKNKKKIIHYISRMFGLSLHMYLCVLRIVSEDPALRFPADNPIIWIFQQLARLSDILSFITQELLMEVFA